MGSSQQSYLTGALNPAIWRGPLKLRSSWNGGRFHPGGPWQVGELWCKTPRLNSAKSRACRPTPTCLWGPSQNRLINTGPHTICLNQWFSAADSFAPHSTPPPGTFRNNQRPVFGCHNWGGCYWHLVVGGQGCYTPHLPSKELSDQKCQYAEKTCI